MKKRKEKKVCETKRKKRGKKRERTNAQWEKQRVDINQCKTGGRKKAQKKRRRRKRQTEIVSGVEMASASIQNNVPIETSLPCSHVSLPGISSNAHKEMP